MIREVASCVLLTCCLFVPHLTAPFFSLLLYYASSNIVSPPSFFFFSFLEGPVRLAWFLKAQKLLSRLPWKDSISVLLSALPLLVVSDAPRAFSTHYKPYTFFSRDKIFPKVVGVGGGRWRQGSFLSPFPKSCAPC